MKWLWTTILKEKGSKSKKKSIASLEILILYLFPRKKKCFFHKVLNLVSSCRFGHFWLCAEISAVEALLLELGHASSVWEKKYFFWTLTWWRYSKVKHKIKKTQTQKKIFEFEVTKFLLKKQHFSFSETATVTFRHRT